MKNRFLVLLFLLTWQYFQGFSQWQVTSPNGQIRTTIQLSNDGKLSYFVENFDNFITTIIIKNSPLGITRNDQDFAANLTNESASNEVIDDRYTMISGKQSSLWNHANQVTLNFKNANNAKLKIIFRAYDDGVAFRYVFPENTGQSVNITGENSTFHLPTGGKSYISKFSFSPDYQQFYVENPIGTAAPDASGWAFPALFSVNSFWYLLTESGLDENFYASHLAQNSPDGLYKIQPPDQNDGNVFSNFATAKFPFSSPWRVIILSKNLSDIVESNLVNHLADASKIANTSWIKPGISSWSWWTDFSSPKDYNKLKEYVDFSKNWSLPYSLVDADWNLMTNGNLEQLAKYAQTQGVGLWVWYNSGGSNNTETGQPRDKMSDQTTRRNEFAQLQKWGIKGVKVDFFLSDKQTIIKQYLGILQDAADYQLMVNFHGCTLPRGWQKTYPNLLSMEAVLGDETLLFSQNFQANSAAHNVNLVFTRNVVGSMDYTPAILSTNRISHNTTSAHELALLAIFESGITHLADKVADYQALSSITQKIIQQLPTTWDETKLLQGEPNKYAFVARRKGENWYISGINGQVSVLSAHFGWHLLTLEIIPANSLPMAVMHALFLPPKPLIFMAKKRQFRCCRMVVF